LVQKNIEDYYSHYKGANDASLLPQNARQHIPIDEYESNLKEITQHLLSMKTKATKSGHPYVVVVCPPKVDGERWMNVANDLYKAGLTSPDRSNESAGIHFIIDNY
jgi:hypothetical protein